MLLCDLRVLNSPRFPRLWSQKSPSTTNWKPSLKYPGKSSPPYQDANAWWKRCAAIGFGGKCEDERPGYCLTGCSWPLLPCLVPNCQKAQPKDDVTW